MDDVQVIAGDSTVEFADGADDRVERGQVVTVVKPDKTVLVHDADGYRPAAWLTRADAVAVERDPPTVEAIDGDRRLRVEVHETHGRAAYPASPAGEPVGACRCGGPLVRAGDVTCLDCGDHYGVPRDGEILAERCECGLPRFRIDRGATVEVCIDRTCESLDEAVRERFDRAWDCPACGADLLILRRGGLIAGCERYPDCETGFVVPGGLVVDDCACGLPVFATDGGRRCLDAACTADHRC